MKVMTNQFNDLCIYLNRQYHSALHIAIEINPIDHEITKRLCDWYKNVMVIKDLKDVDYSYYMQEIKKPNIVLFPMEPRDMYDKLTNFFAGFVYINNNTISDVFEWEDKVISGGYIAGDNKNQVPAHINVQKEYGKWWLAKIE